MPPARESRAQRPSLREYQWAPPRPRFGLCKRYSVPPIRQTATAGSESHLAAEIGQAYNKVRYQGGDGALLDPHCASGR
jgi:hypothetical protein